MKKFNLLNNRGAVDSEGLVSIGFIIIVGLFVLWIFGFNFGRVNEGTVEYDDCREVITIQEGSWQTYFHKFTCSFRKTKSGEIMEGVCISIKTPKSLFSEGDSCLKAYVYEVKNETACKDVIKDGVSYPYLGYDDMCYTNPQ